MQLLTRLKIWWTMENYDSTEVAELLNVRYNNETGQVILEMEVVDPVWKQKILREWQTMKVKLVIDEN